MRFGFKTVTFLSFSLLVSQGAVSPLAIACDSEQCSKEESSEKCTCKHAKGKKHECPHCKHRKHKPAPAEGAPAANPESSGT
jgi:hypothetical protein